MIVKLPHIIRSRERLEAEKGSDLPKQSSKDEAIEHYEKFLDLWEDADPGIDEVEEARKRLAGLM